MPSNNRNKLVVSAATRVNKSLNANKNRNPPISNAASVAISMTRTTNKPRISQRGNKTIIKHREFISDVSNTSSGFTVQAFALNPGIASSFPWLSGVATRFESYTMKQFQVCYEPAVSTATPGTVMVAIDYDANDVTPTDKTTLMSYASAVRSSPWQACTFVAKTTDLTKFAKERYVREMATVSGTDVKTYNFGNLFVATSGIGTAPVVVGELYLEYEVEFQTPQLSTSTAARPSQVTKISWLDKVPTLIASITSGAIPLLWIAQNKDGYTDIVIKTVGHYLLNFAKKSGDAAYPQMAANFRDAIQNAANSNTRFWYPQAKYDNSTTSTNNQSFSRILGWNNISTIDRFTPNYTTLRMVNGEFDKSDFHINMTPIDPIVANGLTGAFASAWPPAVVGPDFPYTTIFLPPSGLVARDSNPDDQSYDFEQTVLDN